eukprot:746338-Hanusia_phi.AAC.6
MPLLRTSALCSMPSTISLSSDTRASRLVAAFSLLLLILLPQVYLLLSCAPAEGRISGIVDVPNAVATLSIVSFCGMFLRVSSKLQPIRIFDQDVRPKKLMPGVSLRVQKV